MTTGKIKIIFKIKTWILIQSMVSSPALKVLSSRETRALEVGKNETSLKLKQSASTKSDNDLQIQLERSQKSNELAGEKI